MADAVAKKLADIRAGDVVVRQVVIVEKVETAGGWTITYSDGTSETFPAAGDPSIEVQE